MEPSFEGQAEGQTLSGRSAPTSRVGVKGKPEPRRGWKRPTAPSTVRQLPSHIEVGHETTRQSAQGYPQVAQQHRQAQGKAKAIWAYTGGSHVEEKYCLCWQRYLCFEFRRQRVTEFIVQLRQLKGCLLLAQHIWSGQPARGPEITTSKHCDTDSLTRNFFIFDGQVMLVRDRDKTSSATGKGRIVARFLPEELSRVMVAYIAWIIPFERVLHRQTEIRGPSEELGAWLWKTAEKGVLDTEYLSKMLSGLTMVKLGVELTTATYGHVAIEFGRRIKDIMVNF